MLITFKGWGWRVWLQGQLMNTVFTSQAQMGGEPATSHFHRSVQSQLGYLTQLITAIVTSQRDWKTISMITRTNKISNCYHPSHLPLCYKCVRVCVCWGVVQPWSPSAFQRPSRRDDGEKLTAGSQTSRGARARGSMLGLRGGSSYVKHLP